MSYVYFARAANGSIKIGVSTDPRKRSYDLQISAPEEITMLGCVPGDKTLEASLHAAFAFCHIRGEWFRPEAPLLAYIESQAQPLPVPEKRDRYRSAHTVSLRERLARVMVAEYGSGPSAIAACAKQIGCSIRTVENWFKGKTLPHWRQVSGLLSKSDKFLDDALITERRETWFTDQFRPRHLMTLVSVGDEETSKERLIKEIAEGKYDHPIRAAINKRAARLMAFGEPVKPPA